MTPTPQNTETLPTGRIVTKLLKENGKARVFIGELGKEFVIISDEALAHELHQARKKERKQVFIEINAWAKRGSLSPYPTQWFIAGLKAIEKSLSLPSKTGDIYK